MGFDKALTLRGRDGRLLLAALAEELSERFSLVTLITNDPAKLEPLAELAPFRREADLHPGAGPAGAIHTALTKLPGQPIFVIACDMPVVDWKVIGQLRRLLEENQADAAVPRHGERWEPLYAFYGPRTEPVFQTFLRDGRRAVRDVCAQINTIYLDLPEGEAAPGLFNNLNTPTDLLRAGLPLPPEI